MADLAQQVQNYKATLAQGHPKKPFVSEDKAVASHMQVRARYLHRPYSPQDSSAVQKVCNYKYTMAACASL